MRRPGGIIASFILAFLIASFTEVSRQSQTCMICRMHRSDATCLGLTRSTYSETDCSRWYAAHVEPGHGHIWERGTCQYVGSLLGMPSRVGCSPGRYPIRLLAPTTQMKFYQRSRDPLEAKKLFANLTDAKTRDDRIDEDDEDRGHLTVDAIQAWEAAGFPGNWDEWWGRFYAKHVEEHAERLIWMKADSHLNFWDWQERRKRGG